MESLKQKDYFWNTLGVFLQNAISPLLLIIITRINGIEDSGIFSFAFSVAIIFWAIAMWGGRTYQVSDVSSKFTKKTYIFTRLALSFAVLVAAFLFCVANAYDPVKTGILLSLVLVKITEAVADAYYGVMQSNRKLYRSGQIMVAKYVVASIVFVATDIVSANLLLSSVSFLVVMTIFLLAVDIPYARSIDSEVKGGLVKKEIVRQGLKLITVLTPVFIVSLFAMFPLNIPRYFIDVYHQVEIGYFGILVMPITLIFLLMTFILQPNVVELSNLFKKGDLKKFNKVVLRISVVTFLLGMITLGLSALIGIPALGLIFGVSFEAYYEVLLILVFAAAINALIGVLINVLVIMRVLLPQLVTLISTNSILVVFSAAIIPQHGIIGAALLFLAVNIVQLLILTGIYKAAVSK